MPGKKIYIGVDVGGTKTAVVLSKRPPDSLGRIEFATLPEKGPERALGLIGHSVRRVPVGERGERGRGGGTSVRCWQGRRAYGVSHSGHRAGRGYHRRRQPIPGGQ